MTTMLDKCAVAGDITQGIDRRGVWTAAITVIGGTSGTAVKLVSSDTMNGEYTDYKTLISAADAETDQYKGFVVDLHGAKKFIKVTGAVMATAVFGDCDHDVKAIAITEGEVPSGADLENNHEVTIIENGEIEITPATGKDGMKKVTATVNVSGGAELEDNKTVSIIENGTIEITPSSGNDAMKKVTATVNVPADKWYMWTVPTNNTYSYAGLVQATSIAQTLFLKQATLAELEVGQQYDSCFWGTGDYGKMEVTAKDTNTVTLKKVSTNQSVTVTPATEIGAWASSRYALGVIEVPSLDSTTRSFTMTSNQQNYTFTPNVDKGEAGSVVIALTAPSPSLSGVAMSAVSDVSTAGKTLTLTVSKIFGTSAKIGVVEASYFLDTSSQCTLGDALSSAQTLTLHAGPADLVVSVSVTESGSNYVITATVTAEAFTVSTASLFIYK